MAFDDELAARVRVMLTRTKNVSEKKMFGGLCFLLHGKLLVGVMKDTLLVRLGPDQKDEVILEDHVSEFKIPGRGAMKGWVVVDLEGVEDDEQLRDWVQRAVKFVSTLPVK
ncbi:MAG: RNA methyltransferase [Planctomycetaceae bacterium]|nr:RNA methyltransferase [Planctomycetaceae bacterium]